MEAIKFEELIIGKNVSVDESATVVTPDGATVNATDILCEFGPAGLTVLDAAKALINNVIVKWVISIIETILQNLITTYCTPAKE